MTFIYRIPKVLVSIGIASIILGLYSHARAVDSSFSLDEANSSATGVVQSINNSSPGSISEVTGQIQSTTVSPLVEVADNLPEPSDDKITPQAISKHVSNDAISNSQDTSSTTSKSIQANGAIDSLADLGGDVEGSTQIDVAQSSSPQLIDSYIGNAPIEGDAPIEPVPEPLTVLGTLMGGGAIWQMRKRLLSSCNQTEEV
ncbi:MAG: PEP-CTERM sorting domain-containing protein [Cyanothece sp. SIO1E1]|nr:PEP-CTERM sorting domain-containing protein [Cyanothece sp. SIO1E1]